MNYKSLNCCSICSKLQKNLHFCQPCNRLLCILCDQKSHFSAIQKNHEKFDLNQIWYTDQQTQFKIYFYSLEYFYFQQDLLDKSKNEIFQVQKFLISQSEQGNLLIPLKEVAEFIEDKFELKGKDLQNKIDSVKQSGCFNIIKRELGFDFQTEYISLKIKRLSLQIIQWILKSIARDKLQPKEQLIFSRLKEYFGISQRKEWSNFIQNLLSNKDLLKIKNHYLDDLIIKRECEEETILLLKSLNYEFDDLIEVNVDDMLYVKFVDFIDKYLKQQSVKSYVQKSKFKTISTNNAIPGGKYGCSLLVQQLGDQELRKQSLGKINALVSFALQQEFLIHYKTFLIKNKKNKSLEPQQDKVLDLQNKILIVLKQSEDGYLTLAQIPSTIKKKFGHMPDINLLGFQKLNQFLQTMKDKIKFEKSSLNHIKIRLKSQDEFSKEELIDFLKEQVDLQEGVSLQSLYQKSQNFYLKNFNGVFSQKNFDAIVKQNFNCVIQEIDNQIVTLVFPFQYQDQSKDMNECKFNQDFQEQDEFSSLINAFEYKVIQPVLNKEFMKMDLEETGEEDNEEFQMINRKFLENLINDD